MIKAINGAVALALLAVGSSVEADDNYGRTLGATCAGCHGYDGVSVGSAASINGLPETHFTKTMQDFRSGKRPSTIMGRIAKGYTDEQIALMAKYYANLK